MSKFSRKIDRGNRQRVNKYVRKRVKEKRIIKQIDAYGKFMKKKLHPNIFKRIINWFKRRKKEKKWKIQKWNTYYLID